MVVAGIHTFEGGVLNSVFAGSTGLTGSIASASALVAERIAGLALIYSRSKVLRRAGRTAGSPSSSASETSGGALRTLS